MQALQFFEKLFHAKEAIPKALQAINTAWRCKTYRHRHRNVSNSRNNSFLTLEELYNGFES